MNNYLDIRVLLTNWIANQKDPLSGLFDVIIISELSEPDSAIRVHLDWEIIRPYLLDLKGKKITIDETKKLRNLIFSLLFPERARKHLNHAIAVSKERNKILRIRLDILSERLNTLPWELAQFEDETIIGFHPYISIVRHSRSPYSWTQKKEGHHKPFRFLLIGSGPVNGFPDVNTDFHISKLEKIIKRISSENKLTVDIVPINNVTIGDLYESLNQKWDVIHFAGHGYITKEGPALVLKKKNSQEPDFLLGNEFMSNLILANPQIVNLTACHSGESTIYGQTNGIAGTLTKAGIPIVIAMQDTIQPEVAYLQSEIMYTHLLRGGDIESAIILSRLALIEDNNFFADWSVPVLYMQYSKEEYVLSNRQEYANKIKNNIRNITINDNASLIDIKNNLFKEFELIVDDLSLNDNSIGFKL